MDGPANDTLEVARSCSEAAEIVGGTEMGGGAATEDFSGALAVGDCTNALFGISFTALDVGFEVLEEVLEEVLDDVVLEV